MVLDTYSYPVAAPWSRRFSSLLLEDLAQPSHSEASCAGWVADPGGLPTGEVELGDGDVGGIAVHLAARVMAAAG
jgi:hypothetical protein